MKPVKSGDPIVGKVLDSMINSNKSDVSVEYGIHEEVCLISKIHPASLNLPNGWYFTKGAFYEEGNSSEECIPCFEPSGRLWQGATV